MIDAALKAISDGGIVGLPTDTVYGVGVDPFNDGAVSRLFELKGRPEGKPVGVLVASLTQAREIADFSEMAVALAEKHWPGALTLIVVPTVVMADWVGHSQLRTLGIRVPDHPVARQLLEASGPLAVTSANLSGMTETMSDDEAREALGDRVSHYIAGVAPGGQASTVVDVSGDEPVVIRRGPIEL